jgi:hypothetical protein
MPSKPLALSKPPAPASTGTDQEPLSAFALRTAWAANPTTPLEAGFIAGLVMATYDIGAISAVIAVDHGVPVEVGKVLEGATTVAFVERSQQLMRCLPMFQGIPGDADLPGITYETERLTKVNWDDEIQA